MANPLNAGIPVQSGNNLSSGICFRRARPGEYRCGKKDEKPVLC